MTKSREIISFCVAGTHSGAGKTTLTLGLLAAFKKRGYEVQPFKCGPDYLDPGHHQAASDTISRNLDTWMMGKKAVAESFSRALVGREIAIVEGVMGLFDGASATSLSGSTAEVALLLKLPVILVVDARSMARSIAALVKGFVDFEAELEIVGVVANNIGSERHREILDQALETADLPPLIGALPRGVVPSLEERHLGLVTADQERDAEIYQRLGEVVEEYLDLDLLVHECCLTRPQLPPESKPRELFVASVSRSKLKYDKVKLGIAKDQAFHFYYADNLDFLRRAGIELIDFSPLSDTLLPPDINGLYLGGGYPELFAQELSANSKMRLAIADFAESGGAIYAECGGLMYLSQKLIDQENKEWQMSGVLPLTTKMEKRRHRLGYAEVECAQDGLFGKSGTAWRGHEFHWSSPDIEPSFPYAPLRYRRPGETAWQAAGYSQERVLGTYIHAHFGGNSEIAANWAAFLRS
ncbi:MAG: cobyrinate a,c-diamide synthase [Deltaproteobacteria bacterium]|nr:cobyrinate a,c-diamide synthase [Candidatus Tharpella sp.]